MNLCTVVRAISAIGKDHSALAKGLEASVVRMKMLNVQLCNPDDLRDTLQKGTAHIQQILQQGEGLFGKMQQLSNAVSSLKHAITSETVELAECTRLFEDVSILAAVEQSYNIEKEQLQLSSF
ncbi:UNVERIFIED_CONTAM: hypothetical protein HDU68_007285 [Siphonaria sp. JEL0065]|nr:hypothetical protein HDU68_007285 [Siphonaria sp. JEL0065]